MFSWLIKLVSACWRPVQQYGRMGRQEGDGGNHNDDGLLWHKDICQHALGDFSMAVVQANSLLEDQSQVETGSRGMFVGIYDGHGGPETSRFISDHLFLGPLSITISPEEREIIKVNNYSASELKNACDDALKRYLSRPVLFKQIHLHTDVRLALGWAGVFTAAATGLYGWKIDFEKSKPGVWIGFILYLVLTSLQTLYSYFVEGDTIFVGRRKTFSKRIITERITISSRTHPVPSSKLSLKPSPTNSPSYSLSINYVQSTSGGKSLLAKGRTHEAKEYSAFFDEKGVMAQEVFERWIGELVEAVMEGKGA